MARALAGAIALEPGGPSALFGQDGALPVYPLLQALDILDFSEHTLWSEATAELAVRPRRRLIGEAGLLAGVDDGAYQAVLGSHVLEHVADPLGALAEWRRVVGGGGHILLVVPHHEGTFDRRRPVTPLEHLRADRDRAIGEDDLTHLPEVLDLHDLARDPGASSRTEFERRCRENASVRAMHHHVFDTRAVAEMCRESGLEVLALRPKAPHDIFCLCRVGDSRVGDCRVGDCRVGDGESFSDRDLRRALARSPFASDRAIAGGARHAARGTGHVTPST